MFHNASTFFHCCEEIFFLIQRNDIGKHKIRSHNDSRDNKQSQKEQGYDRLEEYSNYVGKKLSNYFMKNISKNDLSAFFSGRVMSIM